MATTFHDHDRPKKELSNWHLDVLVQECIHIDMDITSHLYLLVVFLTSFHQR